MPDDRSRRGPETRRTPKTKREKLLNLPQKIYAQGTKVESIFVAFVRHPSNDTLLGGCDCPHRCAQMTRHVARQSQTSQYRFEVFTSCSLEWGLVRLRRSPIQSAMNLCRGSQSAFSWRPFFPSTVIR
jgi:hypothetical protein